MGDALRRTIDELTSGLRPVRRVPRLRLAFGAVALIGVLVGALALVSSLELRTDLIRLVGRDPGFTGILTGLALVAAGGLLAGLAASVPGRERVARAGLALGVAGVATSAITGSALLLAGGLPLRAEPPLSYDATCLATSCLLALPAGLAAVVLAGRAAPYRPLLSALAAASGAVAIGAFAVHLSCPCDGLRHALLAHALAPVSGGVLLAVPFHAALRRAARTRLS